MKPYLFVVLFISLTIVFDGCVKPDISPSSLGFGSVDESKWITISGKVTDNNTGKSLAGAKVDMYHSYSIFGCSTCFEGDTLTDNNGNYTFKFKTDRFGIEYTIICSADSDFQTTNASMPSIFPTITDKLTISDNVTSYNKNFGFESLSFTEINFKNLDGLNETIDGYVIINGDTDMVNDFFGVRPRKFGPIKSNDLRYFLYADYLDTVSFKATVYRQNKPVAIIEKSFVAGPERAKKTLLEYR
jgi:hypothetical protein